MGVFLAKLCGEDKPSGIAEWVRLREQWITRMLGVKRERMPHHNTYRRVLADAIDEEAFEGIAQQRGNWVSCSGIYGWQDSAGNDRHTGE